MKSANFTTLMLAASVLLTACGEDSSSGASGDFDCDVQETATTVTVTQNLRGWGSYKETGTLRDGRIYFVQEYEYESSSMAADECENFKEEAALWKDGSVQVTCSGNKVVRTDYSKTSDIAGYAADQRAQCQIAKGKMEEDGPASANESFSCKVSSTENSVKIEMHVKGYVALVSEMVKASDGFYTITEETFEKLIDADEECRSVKSYPDVNKEVTCSDYKVITKEYIPGSYESLGIDVLVKSYQKNCDQYEDMYR